MQITEAIISRIATRLFNSLFPQALDSYGVVTSNKGTAQRAVNAENANITMKIGNEDIGSGKQPIFVKEGAVKKSSDTVGSSNHPVYMNNGQITACSDTVGATDIPVYISGGVPTVCGSPLNTGISGNAATADYATSAGNAATADYATEAGSIRQNSDERLKKDIKPMIIDLDKLADAPAVYFRWRFRQNQEQQVGTIAQYWEEILPEVTGKDASGFLTMDYGKAALIAAISLAKELRELKSNIK